MTSVKNIFQPTTENEIAPGIHRTSIDGLLYIQNKQFIDDRGFFADITGLKNLEKIIGKRMEIKQLNLAYSHTNVIRGLHAEGWNKLVTTFTGKAFSALADIRQTSPTFGKVEYFMFEPEPNKDLRTSLYVPMGVANSVCVIGGPVFYHYAVDAFYDERDVSGDKALSLFDPDLAIEWPIPREQMILSQRDVDSLSLKEMIAQKN